MRDLGTLVWVLLVVIGVVSSIARSARKAQQQQSPMMAQQQPMESPMAAQQQPLAAQQQYVSAQRAPMTRRSGTRVQSVVVPPPVVAAQASASVPPLPETFSIAQPLEHPNAGVPRWRRLFDNRAALVRAVIASEVLGKPRALRDE